MPQKDAFTLLKEDHDEVKKMFRQFEESGERAFKQKQDLADTIFSELAVHEQIEEEIFYPAVKENASKEGQEIVLEGYEEHHVADMIIEELKAMSTEDENFDAKMKVLRENIEHHIEEEETSMFPEAKKALGEEATAIGEQMEARKEELKEGMTVG
jgi:hemerythrin-like domain-containing protein